MPEFRAEFALKRQIRRFSRGDDWNSTADQAQLFYLGKQIDL